ncbi:MAG: prolipoprotein diacylglyceryl transferase [Thermoleophilaceae bacterium]|nr:prolipoprotein diacylglyceryl transferase [Thermoleophilaceae bacterium]
MQGARVLSAPPIDAVITLDVDPFIEIGPLTLAWHGVMIAVGIAVGLCFGRRHARRVGLDPDELTSATLWLVLAGIVGARAFWLVENGRLTSPAEWLGTRGFSFYGAIVVGVTAAALYLRRRGLGTGYLDAMAVGFPLGMAVGRIGDVINGEHFGPPSDLPWAFRYAHPDAEVPSAELAYHSGGFYEVVLALALLALVLWLRRRVDAPGVMLFAVVGAYSLGRFVMFFWRSDSATAVLGLDGAQVTSLVLLILSAAALAALRSRRSPPGWKPSTPVGGLGRGRTVSRGTRVKAPNGR